MAVTPPDNASQIASNAENSIAGLLSLFSPVVDVSEQSGNETQATHAAD